MARPHPARPRRRRHASPPPSNPSPNRTSHDRPHCRPAFPDADALAVIRTALDEDLGGPDGVDVTTSATIPVDQVSTAHVVAREDGALAGIPVVAHGLRRGGRAAGRRAADASRTRRRTATSSPRATWSPPWRGSTQVTLVGERTMLNIVCRLSGHRDPHPRAGPQRLEGTGATVLDTRKTTPGLRALEKYAVRAGGGTNKRMGLYDVAMIKDNHKLAAGSLEQGVCRGAGAVPRRPRPGGGHHDRRRPSSRSRSGRGSCCATTCPSTCCATTVRGRARDRRGRRARGHRRADARGGARVRRDRRRLPPSAGSPTPRRSSTSPST